MRGHHLQLSLERLESTWPVTNRKAFMGVIILTCRCGQRVKAPGARPGRTGRCPACGGVLEVPPGPGIDPSEAMLDAEQSANLRTPDLAGDDEDLRTPGGYFVEPVQCSDGRTVR